MNRLSLYLIILLATLAGVSPAPGHHFKGLPHFNYFDNYPQVPLEEYLAQSDDYELSLVVYDFQGIDKMDAQQPEEVRLFLVLFNLRHNRLYDGPLTLTLLRDDKPLRSLRFASSELENLYTLQDQLPPGGKYALAVDLPGQVEPIIMPFALSSQKIHWGKWIALSLGLLVAILIIGARRARIQVDRRQAVQAETTNPRIHHAS